MVRRLRMLCPAWLLALAVLCAGSSEVRAQCWENTRCRDLTTEESILECIQVCRSDLTDETPVYPGESHLQPPSELEQNDILPPLSPVALSPAEQMDPESSPRHEHKRSYSMEHFRWGKPVGRKRRPIKVYTNGVEEESAETLPAEMRRELQTNEFDYPQEKSALNQQQKKENDSYKMDHFRWSSPPASKRYGGFMKSWDERSQKPLLTLFKNVINKEHQRKDQ